MEAAVLNHFCLLTDTNVEPGLNYRPLNEQQHSRHASKTHTHTQKADVRRGEAPCVCVLAGPLGGLEDHLFQLKPPKYSPTIFGK